MNNSKKQTAKPIIKLIAPQMSLRPMDTELKRLMSPSMSLVILATLTPSEYDVIISDENVKPLDFSDNPWLIGITVNVDTAPRAFAIADKYRKKGIKVIFGGILPSSEPSLVQNYCDAVCVGEAEELWVDILNDHRNKRLKQIYVNYKAIDVNKIPVPNWNYIQQKDYLYHTIVVSSRGCPYCCEFCYNSAESVINQYRNRPVSDVITEIKSLKSKQIMFIDDNFIGNPEWTRQFISEIKRMNLIWHCAVSANIVHHPELIKEMAESGCRSMFIGFESINKQALQQSNKNQNQIEQYEILINLLHQNSIMINASLVFGFDTDTLQTFQDTLQWLIKNKIHTMTAHILTPYPGTKLYKRFLEEDRITDFNLAHYNTAHVVFTPTRISKEDLYEGYIKIYKDFYSLRNIIKRFPSQPKLIMPFILFSFGYRKFGKFTEKLHYLGLLNFIGRLVRFFAFGIR